MYSFEHYEGSLGKFDYNTSDFVITSMTFIAKASCYAAAACEQDDTLSYRDVMLRFLRLQKFDTNIRVSQENLTAYLSDEYVDYKSDCICYIGNFEKTVRLPVGCRSARAMFTARVIPSDINLEGFDKGSLVDTSHMFEDADLSAIHNFSKLNINTKNVTKMTSMFGNCVFGNDFDFGNRFITTNVRDMYAFVRSATFKGYVDFGFDTSNVRTMREMFANINVKDADAIILCNGFDTSNVEDMAGMFFGINMRNEKHMVFDLGLSFYTNNVLYMYGMFEDAKLPDAFTLGNNFDFESISSAKYMFANAVVAFDFMISSKVAAAAKADPTMFEETRYVNGAEFVVEKAVNNSNRNMAQANKQLTVSDIFGF